jgi:uncharacterized membrane protein
MRRRFRGPSLRHPKFMTRPTTLLLSHTFATVFMTGLIWFVQIVHYPLLASVGREAYPAYQQQHEQRTGWVVAPVMLLELATGILLVFYAPERDRRSWLIVNLALLVVIWLSTFLLQVPQHQRLESGFQPAAHHVLLVSNWLRTVAWSARSLLLFYLLASRSPNIP